jgi:hypothetical protein
MSVAFSRIIKAGNRQREFNFTQAYSGSDRNFVIDVVTDAGERISFRMDQTHDGQWVTLSPYAPPWIQEVTSVLAEAITEEVIHTNRPAPTQKHWYHLF